MHVPHNTVDFKPFCCHWQQRVPVGRTSVTCSSLPLTIPCQSLPYPDFGIYLSTIWSDEISPIWTSGVRVKRVANLRKYPALVANWPDMCGPKPEMLVELVEICVSKLRQRKWVDIGCTAGHGRTGTFLACLLVKKERLDWQEAITSVRSRYCKQAIETKAQERAIRIYAENLERRIRR